MSFGFLGLFREGAWQSFRSFVLQQRRDVPKRVRAINAELERIGFVRVSYARSDPNNPSSPATEERTRFFVQEGTSLGRLFQAYVALGGNPFDISMFMYPDSLIQTDTDSTSGDQSPILSNEYPYGGMTWPVSSEPGRGGTYTGGWLPLWRYPPRRTGSRATLATEMSNVAFSMDRARSWVQQEIGERHKLEAQILKLCDLAEQLTRERDEIIPQAVGGTVSTIPFDGTDSHHVVSIVSDYDAVFYAAAANGDPDFTQVRDYDPTVDFPTLVPNAPTGEEDWTALG